MGAPAGQELVEATLADLLRERGIARVLQDISNMPGFAEMSKKFDPITADWTYIRWLGDRKGIEKLTKTWDKTVVDRTDELTSWVDFCYRIRKRVANPKTAARRSVEYSINDLTIPTGLVLGVRGQN